jgi:hypothetical protein
MTAGDCCPVILASNSILAQTRLLAISKTFSVNCYVKVQCVNITYQPTLALFYHAKAFKKY